MISIINCGSQYTQLIARRVREDNVYSEIVPHDTPWDELNKPGLEGVIISGGPDSVYEAGAMTIDKNILTQDRVPVLGTCYGMQLISYLLGGKVESYDKKEYGDNTITILTDNLLFKDIPKSTNVWMSHGDSVTELPEGFNVIARSSYGHSAAIHRGNIYGIQFHAEVNHTPFGRHMLKNYLDICQAKRTWTPEKMIDKSIAYIRATIGDYQGPILSAVSGGVDSSVATALVALEWIDRLYAAFVNNGLLRKGEPEQVVNTFQKVIPNFTGLNAIEDFMDILNGVTEPEAKRRHIGELFIRIFEQYAKTISPVPEFLIQGTIYPDVVESAEDKRNEGAHRIKTHHNVGGLPDDMQFTLIEPLRYLFKDEVRAIGEALGLPDEIVWRQPFPGPGLAIRCPGEVTWERLERLRDADYIFTSELDQAGLLRMKGSEGSAQAFAVLLPVKSVGVMGDDRTYEEPVVLRAVQTDDFMTATAALLPPDLIVHIGTRIVNEVEGINRVMYDYTSKPPATIEWE